MADMLFLSRLIHGHSLYVLHKLYPWLAYNGVYSIVGNFYYLKIWRDKCIN